MIETEKPENKNEAPLIEPQKPPVAPPGITLPAQFKTTEEKPLIKYDDFANGTAGTQVPPVSRSSMTPPTPTTDEEKPLIKYDDFAKLDLRVARILEAEKVEGADKLLKLTIKVGNETRTLAAGIAKSYSPEDLIDKKIIMIYNLEARKLRGILSQGMLLAAGESDDDLSIITLDRDLVEGTEVH